MHWSKQHARKQSPLAHLYVILCNRPSTHHSTTAPVIHTADARPAIRRYLNGHPPLGVSFIVFLPKDAWFVILFRTFSVHSTVNYKL